MGVDEWHVLLPMVGRMRLKETRSEHGFKGRILSATIRRRADRWFVALCVECQRETVDPHPVTKPTEVVGVELGLRRAAVIHDGEAARVVEPAQALRKHLRKLARLNRQLARKRKASRNGEKAKLKLARLHYRIFCLRQDYLHQLSSSLARTRRTFDCAAFGVSLDRDENAALNLRAYGVKELATVLLPEDLREVTPVERKALARHPQRANPASSKQEASGCRLNGRHTQRRAETLAGAATDRI